MHRVHRTGGKTPAELSSDPVDQLDEAGNSPVPPKEWVAPGLRPMTPADLVGAPLGAKILGSKAWSRPAPKLNEVELVRTLRLRNPEGELNEIPTANYYVDTAGTPRPWIKKLAEVALSRSPVDQLAMNDILTQRHDDLGMSFKVKDEETGAYDKVFKVPCQGAPVPLKKAHFDGLVASTEPVMRALRHVMQCVYAKKDPTPKELGIDHLPKAEQKRLLDTIRESVYFEPELICPEMKDYPFLSVAGFDAAIGDLEDPRPVFFEYNLGTPSGLSNNIQLLESLRENDPKMFAAISKYLPKDETYEILKQTMDDCARAWTKNDKGISVVIGPGYGNPAHPDIASIAMFSGMPLVSQTDMYVDAEGDVRLRTGGDPDEDPVVTGIYGRMEESFFLQDSRKDLPIRDPHATEAEVLSDELGVNLEHGVAYAFIRDKDGNITGVERDDKGKPREQKVYGGGMGPDPKNPLAPRGNFLDAIKNRKLYYSGLGGRCVDDKRVFQVVSDEIAPKYVSQCVSDASFFPEEDRIARPPRTYHPTDYSLFLETDQLEEFAVKEPDKSGADGVSLMVNLTPDKREKIRADVRADPNRFIVQDFIRTPVMCAPEAKESGGARYRTTAGDWRVFVMFGPDGVARGGPNSLLLRIAGFDSAYSNTSCGGGYGIGAVLEETPVERERESVLPERKQIAALPASQRQNLRDFCQLLNMITEWTDVTNGSECPREPGFLTFLADVCHRKLMSVLGPEHAPMMNLCRDYDRGELSQSELHEALVAWRLQLVDQASYQTDGVSEILRAELARLDPRIKTSSMTDQKVLSRDELAKKMTITQAPMTAELRRTVEAGTIYVTEETGVYQKVDDPFASKVLDELRAAGGEMRMVRVRKKGESEFLTTHAGAAFRIDDDGRPIIDIDLTQPSAIAALAHEYQHFSDFLEKKASYMATGVDEKKAAFLAESALNEPEALAATERRALAAEMKAETDTTSPFNRTMFSRPHEPTQPGFVARMCYPEVEGLRQLLWNVKWAQQPLDESRAKVFIDDLVHRAEGLKSEAERARLAEAEKLERALENGGTSEDRIKALHLRLAARQHRDANLFQLIFGPDGITRFATDRTLPKLQTLFEKFAGDKLPLGPQLGVETLTRAFRTDGLQQQQ